MSKKGFVISTTLYSIFGIMMVTVSIILFILSNNRVTLGTMTDKIKMCIEECNTPENICDNSSYSSFKLSDKLKKEVLDIKTKFDNVLEDYYHDDYGEMPHSSYYFNKYNGLYRTSATFYYYRGDVKYNYIKFEGIDTLFRIVSFSYGDINHEDYIKLITEDAIIAEHYNGDGSTTTTFSGSKVESTLNNWYDSISYLIGNYLINSTFCNDTTNSFKNRKTSPELDNCEGTMISSYVGLLTADELIYAGVVPDLSTSYPYYYCDTYLSSGNSTVTLTSYDANYIILVNDNYIENHFTHIGLLDHISPSDNDVYNSLRPVINVKGNIKVTGSGTIVDPYVIQ